MPTNNKTSHSTHQAARTWWLYEARSKAMTVGQLTPVAGIMAGRHALAALSLFEWVTYTFDGLSGTKMKARQAKTDEGKKMLLFLHA
jgi:hypothetical protein